MSAQISLTTEQSGDNFYVAQFKTNELAIFSYYVQSEKQAFLIDPPFDIKTFTQFINKRESKLKYVLLTHYHADFLSGHTEFKVPIVMGKGAKRAINSFEVSEFDDGQSFKLGSVSVKVLHTPGHTPESACFLLNDGKSDICLFSGDTVFLGQVGRPDLATGQNVSKQDLAGMLYDSVQKIKTLDRNIRLYPGHGSGSACGKAIGAGNYCNLQNQHSNNYGFKFTEKQDFVKALTEGIPKPPSYFFADAKMNQTGPPSNYETLLKSANVPLNKQQFLHLAKTVQVIETRPDLKQGLFKGAYWLSSKGSIVNWLGNLMKLDDQFIIIAQEGKAQDIIERYFRVGYFNIKGYNNFPIAQIKENLVNVELIHFEQYRKEKQTHGITHVDCRSLNQYKTVGVVQNSIQIPLADVLSRVDELKGHSHVVVSCKTGQRARVAASVFLKHGIPVQILDQNLDKFEANGLKLIK